MSEQSFKQKSDTSGKLAIVGDRELVIGYRLIGIDDTFITDNEDASKKITKLMIKPTGIWEEFSSEFIKMLFCWATFSIITTNKNKTATAPT